MHVDIESSWKKVLTDECEKEYFGELIGRVRAAYSTEDAVYPPASLIFEAFTLCPFSQVRVVILGQDPYHGPDQAQGLAFSVPEGVATPPSLRNIYKEITADIPRPAPQTGNLEPWARQGVFLLNSVLTVRGGEASSHRTFGWQQFTDTVITSISDHKELVVFMLWGAFAQSKLPLIDTEKHLALTAPHPSPLSSHRGFLGCQHFSACNAYLLKHGKEPIKW